MKKLIVSLLFIVSISLINFGQTSPNVKSKVSIQTEVSLTKTAIKTDKLFKGMPVYKSSKGSYFVVVQSKKTGNYYKTYVTL